jgi:hypothetical protein
MACEGLQRPSFIDARRMTPAASHAASSPTVLSLGVTAILGVKILRDRNGRQPILGRDLLHL